MTDSHSGWRIQEFRPMDGRGCPVFVQEGPILKRCSQQTAEMDQAGKAYTHPLTGRRLAGPDAEPGPVEIDEAAYQATLRFLHRPVTNKG